MNKKELIKEVRDVMSGVSGHTAIVFGKKDNKWVYETGLSAYNIVNWGWDWVSEQQYCCSDKLTLKETEGIIDDAELYESYGNGV